MTYNVFGARTLDLARSQS